MKDALQEQLVAARRNQILDAAAKVFAARGFHPTTIKDIARAAGIADGTIYTYFENKPALLLGILERMTAAARRAEDFSNVTEGDFRVFLRAYLSHPLMVPKADNFELFRAVISEVMVNAELRERYYRMVLEPTMTTAEAYFQQWAAQRAIRPVDIHLTMRALSGMVLGLILEHIMGDETLQSRWDELPDFLTDLILSGIGSDTPRRDDAEMNDQSDRDHTRHRTDGQRSETR